LDEVVLIVSNSPIYRLLAFLVLCKWNCCLWFYTVCEQPEFLVVGKSI